MSKTRVSGGKIISTDNPNRKVGSTYLESPDPQSTPGRGTAGAKVPIAPLTSEQKKIAGTLQDKSPQIDPSQPSPTTVQAGAGLPGAPTSTPNLAPEQSASMNGQTFTQGQQFKQGFQQTTASGAAAPATQGMANQTVQQSIIPPKEDTSIVDAFIEEDKGFQQLKDNYADYFSPENQKTSLMDTYNKLFKKSGLDQLDEDIIDAQTVIEGTEDDIRNEIEQAGGFGTDSQVQALALSRNKVLLKNYNNLVAMRESKANNLNTMMSLAEKDRAYADQQVDRMLNFDMQMLNFREKFVQNARDQYNKYTPQQLNAMLAGNPRQLAFAESIMGVGPGGLERLANAPLSESAQLDLEHQRLVNKKLKQDINLAGSVGGGGIGSGGGSGALVGPDGKPLKLTATQVDSLTGFDNTVGGAQKAQALLAKGVKTGPLESLKLWGAKIMDKASPEQLDMEQTLSKIKADFMKSISGAAVSESEAKRLAKFLPEIGDQEGVLKSKLENLISESQKGKTNFLRTLGASGGNTNTVVGPDGNEYEITN